MVREMQTSELMEIAKRRLLRVADRPEIVMSRGQGMYLYDTDGNRYIDFVGGWAVNCLGHSPAAMQRALAEQAGRLVNASPSFYNEPMLAYADELLARSCFDRIFFMSTGAEANEGAIKLARKYGSLHRGGAYEIITTRRGFHGRTLTTMAASGKEAWNGLFAPKTQGFPKSEFNQLRSVERLITAQTCAVMVEPIQGEGGVHVAGEAYIRGLRQICDRESILLIFDEIQTGMGRTGKLFCYEHYEVEPDIVTLGKGIGGGFPLSAMLTTERLNIFEAGDQGGTYTGQPLAMAAGKAVLDRLIAGGVIENCERMGRRIMEMLHLLGERYEICNIRGRGLLIAFDLQHTPGPEVVARCLRSGLLINSPQAHVIRLMPPLIVTEAEVRKLESILRKSLERTG